MIYRQGCPVSGGPCGYPGVSDASDTVPRNSPYACACARLTENLRQPVSDASDGAQRLVGRFLQPSQRIGCKPAPALSFLSWPFFVWPGYKPAYWVRTQVRTPLVPNNPAHASADAAFSPLPRTAKCEPQTLQTSVCTLTVAKRRACAPRIGISPGRPPFTWGMYACAGHNNRR